MSCVVCTRALPGEACAAHITRRLQDENNSSVCNSCRASIGLESEANAGRAALVVNELITPEVDYDSWKQFAELVYKVQDDYCVCVATAVRNASEKYNPSIVLGSVWLLYAVPLELHYLQDHGPSIIMQLTQRQGVFWCKMAAHLVYTRAMRAAAIYNDTLTTLADFDDIQIAIGQNLENLVQIMQQEVRHTFSGALPFSIYTLCSGFVATLLVKNFTFYEDRHHTAFTNKQFRALLLTISMGSHQRLGDRSPLLALESDILQFICSFLHSSHLLKHSVFHTSEQWLVA
jgi:hypothetical protein